MLKKVLFICLIVTLLLFVAGCDADNGATKIKNEEEASETIAEVSDDVTDISDTLDEISNDLG
jgi:outer membrane lipoprotein-sorting protein